MRIQCGRMQRVLFLIKMHIVWLVWAGLKNAPVKMPTLIEPAIKIYIEGELFEFWLMLLSLMAVATQPSKTTP